MSSRALRALQTSLGKDAAAELFPARGGQAPRRGGSSRGNKPNAEDAEVNQRGDGMARSKRSAKAETSKTEKEEPMTESLTNVQGTYGRSTKTTTRELEGRDAFDSSLIGERKT